jgi:hypothetical protein
VAWSITLDGSLDYFSVSPARDITIIKQAAKHSCGASVRSVPLDTTHVFTPGAGISSYSRRRVNPSDERYGKGQNIYHKTVARND